MSCPFLSALPIFRHPAHEVAALSPFLYLFVALIQFVSLFLEIFLDIMVLYIIMYYIIYKQPLIVSSFGKILIMPFLRHIPDRIPVFKVALCFMEILDEAP